VGFSSHPPALKRLRLSKTFCWGGERGEKITADLRGWWVGIDKRGGVDELV
jgi:hypothetical protein